MEDQGKTLKVAIYLRVSTDEQVDKYGLDAQESAVRALIQSRPGLNNKGGLVFAGEKYLYKENGVSGTLPVNERPEFARLKQDILMSSPDNRPFDAVAVYKIDRFARKLTVLLDIVDFFETYGIKFMSANESIDTSTPFGRAILSIIGVIAELDRENIIGRTQAGREQAFKNGIVLGSNAPYGYTKNEEKKYQIVEEEAEVIRDIFKMYVEEKRSTEEIARILSEKSVITPQVSAIKNKKRKGEILKKNSITFWRQERIMSILKDEIYIGKIYGNKRKGNKILDKKERTLSLASSPAIIDIVSFEKAQARIETSRYEKQIAKDDHKYLLRGLLKCDCCYSPERDTRGLITWSGERKEIHKGARNFTYFYKCGRRNLAKSTISCKSLPLPAEPLERYVVDFIEELLKNPKAVISYQNRLKSSKNNIKILDKKEADCIKLLDKCAHRAKNLYEAQEHGLITTLQLKEKLAELQEEEINLNKTVAGFRLEKAKYVLDENYNNVIKKIGENYSRKLSDNLKNNRQYAMDLLHDLIEEIVVYTRPTKDTDVIAGKRKEGQEIPYRLHIKLKLPEEILKEIYIQTGEETKLIQDSYGSKNVSSAA